MKNLKNLALGTILCLGIAIQVLAGDMPGPGFVQNEPKNEQADLRPASCGPATSGVERQNSANLCVEATADPFNEAIIIAINLMISVY